MRRCSRSSATGRSSSSRRRSRSRCAQAGIEEVVLHTGQHYDRELSQVFFDELGLAEPRLPARPRARADPARDAAGDRGGASRRSGPTGCSSSATRTRRSPAREAAPAPACPSRTSRRACAASTSTMPEERNRIEVDRLAALLLCPDERSRGDSSSARACRGRVEVVGDVMADAAACSRRSRASASPPRAARARARPLRRSPRSTARRTSQPDGSARIVEGLSRLDEPVVFPAHPRTRAALAEAGIELGPDVRLDRAARLPRLRRARLAGARDPHRLGRAAEGGVLVRRPVRDAAAVAPSGSTRSRPGRTCSSTTTPTRSPRPSRAARDARRARRSSTATGTRAAAIAAALYASLAVSMTWDVAIVGAGYVGAAARPGLRRGRPARRARRRRARASSTRSTAARATSRTSPREQLGAARRRAA